jgi:DNA-binding IclR family transcriptional regulator
VLRVGEVSRALELPKASVSRLLSTMGENGLLEREPGGGMGYRVGARALIFNELYIAHHSLLDQVEQAATALVKEFGFVSYICKLDRGSLLILGRKHGSFPLRLVHDVGHRTPIFTTATARALLARMSDEQALELLASDPGYPGDPEQARSMLGEIRRYGISSVLSSTPGVAAAAAAIVSPMEDEAIAFSITYPLAAADEALRLRMIQRVREEAAKLGRRVGDEYWRSIPAEAPDMRALLPGERTNKP